MTCFIHHQQQYHLKVETLELLVALVIFSDSDMNDITLTLCRYQLISSIEHLFFSFLPDPFAYPLDFSVFDLYI